MNLHMPDFWRDLMVAYARRRGDDIELLRELSHWEPPQWESPEVLLTLREQLFDPALAEAARQESLQRALLGSMGVGLGITAVPALSAALRGVFGMPAAPFSETLKNTGYAALLGLPVGALSFPLMYYLLRSRGSSVGRARRRAVGEAFIDALMDATHQMRVPRRSTSPFSAEFATSPAEPTFSSDVGEVKSSAAIPDNSRSCRELRKRLKLAGVIHS